MSLIKMY